MKMGSHIIASMSSRGTTTATTTVSPDGESYNSKVSQREGRRDPPMSNGVGGATSAITKTITGKETASKKAAAGIGKSDKSGRNADVSVVSGSGSAPRGGGGLLRFVLGLFRKDTFAFFFLMAVSTGLSIVVAVTDMVDDFGEAVHPRANMTRERYEAEYKEQSFSLPQMVNAVSGMCVSCGYTCYILYLRTIHCCATTDKSIVPSSHTVV